VVVIGVLAALFILYLAGLAGLYSFAFVAGTLQSLRLGAVGTLELIAIVIPLGFALGFIFGWSRTSPRWFLRAISTTYIEFFRGMPPLVLVFFAYLIALIVFVRIPRIDDPVAYATYVGVVALAAHSGAYQAEIVRAGILSVPSGQREAAESIGMTKGKIMLNVVLPQMFRISLPALGNEFASVIKDTSLLAVISILELTFQGTNLVSTLPNRQGFGGLTNILVIWVEVALIYFTMTYAVSRALLAVERKYRVPGLEAAQL